MGMIMRTSMKTEPQRIEVRHKGKCQGLLGYFVNGSPKGRVLKAADFERLDGTHPVPGELFKEVCSSCGEPVYMNEIEEGDTTPQTAELLKTGWVDVQRWNDNWISRIDKT